MNLMSHREPYKEPESDVNIPKAMKKTAITWIITGVLAVTCYAFIALGDSHYETKEQARSDMARWAGQYDALVTKIQQLTDVMAAQDKKIDRLQYTIDYYQTRDGRATSPKQKENP